MQKAIIVIIVLATIIGCSTFKPNVEVLKQVTADGRFIYQYDRACWIATDSLLATNPNLNMMGMYIARKVNESWNVAFGKLSDAENEFLIAYDVTLDSNANTDVKGYDPPRINKGFFYKAAKSIRLARKEFDFHPDYKRYNIVVQRIKKKVLRVYFMPPQIEANVYPLGGDGYSDVNTTNFKIINKVRMHNEILYYNLHPDSMEVKFTFSTAVLTKIPTPTDVFLVLTRPQEISHIVFAITEEMFYVIRPNGTMFWMTTEEWLSAD